MIKYFAKLDSNKVISVHGVEDRIATTEQAGIDYLNELFNYPFWKQCAKDGSIRKTAAIVGSTYDEDRDAFIHKQPFPSWILNETTCYWEAPVAYPITFINNRNIGGRDISDAYEWNEETTSWDLIP